MIKTYNDYLKESIDFIVDVEEPFKEDDEYNFAKSFSIVIEPITIKEVSGEITEDLTALEIIFSNGDILEYTYMLKGIGVKRKAFIKPNKNSKEVKNIEHLLDEFLGTTGSVIGDLCALYKDLYMQYK